MDRFSILSYIVISLTEVHISKQFLAFASSRPGNSTIDPKPALCLQKYDFQVSTEHMQRCFNLNRTLKWLIAIRL